ncbi:unnamed protein product [Pocillopora meandrina]|uniref:Uncharacterized protein n=1 Tax=Pocillopora meandrina TaxID=46732 RepID=A0AAU9W5W3_9CNID|nr:unnamed protein product [Pocillopora meandrina]
MDITLRSKVKEKESLTKEYRNPLFRLPREDPFHFPLTYCRECSNMETDASLSILPNWNNKNCRPLLKISSLPLLELRHFLLECHLKGHLHLKMEELLQPVDTLDIKGNLFKHISVFHSVYFPTNGPIMGKRTIGWDPSFQKMTVSNNILRGDVTIFLLLKGGGYHRCQFHTSYRTEEPVTPPENHVVEHRIMRTDLDDKDGKKVQLEEIAVARVNPL